MGLGDLSLAYNWRQAEGQGGRVVLDFIIGDISVEYHDGSLLMLRFSQGSNWHFLMSLGWQERKRKNNMGFKW